MRGTSGDASADASGGPSNDASGNAPGKAPGKASGKASGNTSATTSGSARWRRWAARLALAACSLCAAACGALVLAGPGSTPEAVAAAPVVSPAGWQFRFLGEQRLRWRLPFQDTPVGGLSGIDYDPAADLFYLISDDRSERAPARFYTARLALSAAGFAGVQLQSVVFLRQADGRTWPARPHPDAVDPEAIRFDPVRRAVLWTDEGQRSVSLLERRFGDTVLADPRLRLADLQGGERAAFARLPHLRMQEAEQGPRGNLTFEGLARVPGDGSLWLSMEGPLWQDGPLADAGRGALLRFTHLDGDPGARTGVLGQYAYRTDPWPQRPLLPGAFVEHGVAEILALSATRLLVLERSYALGRGFSARLFEARVAGASDVRDLPSLAGREIRLLDKRLVFDFASLQLPHLDNIEGMSWGPDLPGGKRTLVFVSDDNFNLFQVTQLLAFEVAVPPDTAPQP